MNLSEKHKETIEQFLSFEHLFIADKLNLVENQELIINESLLKKSVGMLDELSRLDEEMAQKIVVACAAILWTYKEENWEGLREFLILVLTRVGFSPSSIMIDSEYDYEKNQYSGLQSFINELSITAHQLKHEISVGDETFLVTDFQKNVWEKLSSIKLLGISAPTSAGKSFIILLKAIDTILKQEDGNIIYIVPTLSLVAQVSSDFNEYLDRFGIQNYRVSTTFNSQDTDENKIYVLTQEKALSAFSQEETPFQKIRMLVIDEIQNIERVADEDDQRAKILYDALTELSYNIDPDVTIVSGPRVKGLKNFGAEVFKETSVDEEETLSSPVASFTYSISKIGGKYYFNQYSDVVDQSTAVRIDNYDQIAGMGGSYYQEDFLEFLSVFISNLGLESRNIIFSPTTGQARKTATRLSTYSKYSNSNEKIDSLIRYLRETVHEDYAMCETLKKGFLYHHGKTPQHVRVVVEKAIRDKLVPNVVCTTTLMQGVNLPAQNVIMRNPYLALRKRNGVKPKLTNYEIANLRGRAGRLLKDFIGRTFVLDENAFDQEDDQGELFPEAVKEIRAGYGEKFNQFEEEVIHGLDHDLLPNEVSKDYAYLMTHIRQTILRHELEESKERLTGVGIEVSNSKLQDLESNLSGLSVPKEVCFKNRYWDPLDLDRLYNEIGDINLPTSVRQYRLENRLESIIMWLSDRFPFYYKRYLELPERIIQSLSISAKQWMSEWYLKDILSGSYFDDSNKIERKISLLQNKISFGLPLLLKPLYDIKHPDSTFLHFIEMGAFRPNTRKMIELNIPRETAIYINKNFPITDFEDIINNLEGIVDQLDYWRRIQVEQFI